jgi:cysteine desulfurase
MPTQPLYLDHAATTPVRPEVRLAMEPYLADVFGNPSSAHAWGRRAAAALEGARERAAAALGARPAEVFFVRGGTESDNLAVLGAAGAATRSGRPPLIVHSAVEHKAVQESAEAVAAAGGRALEVRVDASGALDMDALDAALALHPSLVSVMWVNNEVGTVLPVPEVVRRARARDVPVHTDAVQAIGKVPVRVGGDDAPDLLSVTGHKIYGPKGTGVLYARSGVRLQPLLFGGGQERGLRPGTQDVAGAWGMAIAVELAAAEQAAESERLGALRAELEALLAAGIEGLEVHGARGARAPHVANVGIPGVDQEALLAALDLEGIAVSSGSACNSGVTRASHVLRAMYGDEADGRATVRFSLGRGTSAADVERAAHVTTRLVGRLRARAAPRTAGAPR